MIAVRHLGYLGIFLLGFVLVPGLTVLVVDVVNESASSTAAGVSAIVFVAWFWFWAHAREARFTSGAARQKDNRIALLLLSIIGLVAGIGLIFFFGRLLPQMWVHPLVAILPLGGLVGGCGLAFAGLSGLTRYLRPPRTEDVSNGTPNS